MGIPPQLPPIYCLSPKPEHIRLRLSGLWLVPSLPNKSIFKLSRASLELLLGQRQGRRKSWDTGHETEAALHPSLDQNERECEFPLQPGAEYQNLRIMAQARLTLFLNKLPNKAMLTIFILRCPFLPVYAKAPSRAEGQHLPGAKSIGSDSGRF